MKRILMGLGMGIAVFASSAWAADGKVLKIELRPGRDRTTLSIRHTGQGKFRLFKNEGQSNVIIEAENLSLPPALTRLVDAAASEGPVLQMTPYNSQHAGHPMAKVVLQLRGNAEVTTADLPDRFEVSFVRKTGGKMAGIGGRGAVTDELKARQSALQKSEEIAKRLVDVLSAPQDEKRYFGSKVTFEGKDVEVPDVFRLVGESSGLNIIWDTDVEGQKTNLSVMKDIPWDQLLDLVVQQKTFKATVMGNVVRIMTIDTFNKQAEAKKKEMALTEDLEPVIMSVVPLGFSQAADMKKLISELIQERGATGTAASADGAATSKLNQDFRRGRIETDERTNSLIITNTRDSIERIRRLVKELDVPVPQILIDSRIVIASESFNKSLGITWAAGLFSSSGTSGVSSASGGGVGAPMAAPPFKMVGSSGSPSGATPLAISAPTSGGLGTGISLGTTPAANIQAAISISEADGLTKTLASPRVIVNNNKPATISDGQSVTITPQPTTPGTVSTPTTVSALLSLTVTPQVTSAGSVQLKNLSVTKNEIGTVTSTTIPVTTKTLSTDVLIDSGNTLVLGGVYSTIKTRSESGIPLLKDLPFLGQLFRSNSATDKKDELMVFITPQILDPQASSQAL